MIWTSLDVHLASISICSNFYFIRSSNFFGSLGTFEIWPNEIAFIDEHEEQTKGNCDQFFLSSFMLPNDGSKTISHSYLSIRAHTHRQYNQVFLLFTMLNLLTNAINLFKYTNLMYNVAKISSYQWELLEMEKEKYSGFVQINYHFKVHFWISE